MDKADIHLINNRYQLGIELGAGGMGTVYKGIDTQTDETVAIKLLNPEAVAKHPEILERFKREGQALRQLNHPNIVKMLTAIEEDNKQYLVMEYVSGGDLSQLLRKEGRMSISRILTIAIELADALTRAHYLKIIHRDLKPANILIAKDGTPRLTDFGVAIMGHLAGDENEEMTVGTPHYLSPEILGSKPLDTRTDIWTFGILIFEMLTRRLPFNGSKLSEIANAIMRNHVPDLETLRPDCPIALVDLVYRMLDKDRNYRISSVRLVGAKLETIIQGIDLGKTILPMKSEGDDTRRFATPVTIPEFVRHNMPIQVTPFIGRKWELNELAKLITDPQISLITILALGGMGKSRLALEIATRFTDSTEYSIFPNGIWLVELAALTDPERIPAIIAETIGYQFREGNPKEQVLSYLGNKKMLLIMDNYEHLLDGARTIGEILRAAPGITILATSRQRLNIIGEQLFTLGGLPFPSRGIEKNGFQLDNDNFDAVKLFIQSAQRIRPDFDVQNYEIPYLIDICRLVSGMPLAIMLAATWVETLSPEEIVEELEEDLAILETEYLDVPKRQRSVQAVLDYSWQRLDEQERRAFARISVFHNGMIRKAAQAVTGAKLRTLQLLVNKGVLQRDPASGRYETHDLLRQYAEYRLDEAGETQKTHEEHSNYFTNFMAQRKAEIKGPQQIEALKSIEEELDNVRASWQWLVKKENYANIDLQAESLALFFIRQSRFQEGEELFNEAVHQLSAGADEDNQATLGRIMTHYAHFLHLQRKNSAEGICRKSLSLARASNNQANIAYSLWVLTDILRRFDTTKQGDTKAASRNREALRLNEECCDIYRKIDDKWGLSNAIRHQSYLATVHGQASEKILMEGIELAQEVGDKYNMAQSLHNLGAWHQSINANWEEAERHYRECLSTFREVNNIAGITFELLHLSFVVFLMKNDTDSAVSYLDEALSSCREYNLYSHIVNILSILSAVTYISDQNDEAQKYTEEVLQLLQEHNHSFDESPTFLGHALCGLGNCQAARFHLFEGLSLMHYAGDARMMLFTILGIALLKINNEKYVRAIELISFVRHHKLTPQWWYESYPGVNNAITNLNGKLDEEAHNAAWERGKLLDLETVVQELLAEFGEENNDAE